MRSAAVILAAAAAVASAAVPTFPNDWTAITTSHVVVNQGGTINSDGSVSCAAQAPECKVQTGFQAARQYYDVTNQRMKMAAPDNSGIVYDFKAGKVYQVTSTGTCQGYCPIPKNQDQLFPIGINPNATSQGSAVGNQYCDGQNPCVDWRFEQKPLFNITFETDDFYVTTVNGKSVPITLFENLTPFGMPLGFQSQTWAQFVAGTPPASVFNVVNATSCPEAQCSSGDGDGDSDSHHHHSSTSTGFPPSSHQIDVNTPRFLGMVSGISMPEAFAKMTVDSKFAAAWARLNTADARALSEYAESLPEGHAMRELLMN
jgi:hypothetical protein